MDDRHHQGRQDNHQPENKSLAGQQGRNQEFPPLQKAFGIPEWKLHRERIGDFFLPGTTLVSLKLPEQFNRTGEDVALDQIGFMELSKQQNDFILSRVLIGRDSVSFLPELLHRALTIHFPDQGIGRGIETMVTTV